MNDSKPVRALIFTPPLPGHFHPFVGPAKCLRADGHVVGWICIAMDATLRQRIRQLDAEPFDVTAHEVWLPHDVRMRMSATPEGRIARFRHELIDLQKLLIEPTRAIIRQFRPDVVLCDAACYAGVIAAHLEHVPDVCIHTNLTTVAPTTAETELTSIAAAISGPRDALFRDHGLAPEFRLLHVMSSRSNIVFSTEELVAKAGDVPRDLRLVGPTIPTGERGDERDFPWDRVRTDVPIVYASFGTTYYGHTELLVRIAEAAAPLGVQLIISAKEFAPELRSLPGDVLVAEYVPQLALLPRTSVFVTHGGHNSLMEAIYYGVPMVIVPMATDQTISRHFAEHAGIAVGLDPATLTAESCRRALATMLEPRGPHRDRMAAMSAAYRAKDGARGAADEVVRVARETSAPR